MSGSSQSNPLISLGSLNRLRASVTIPSFTALNVTAPYLGKEGISISIEGEAVTYLPALTGGVPSPEPYQMVRVTMQLLKSQNLAAQYKAQYELLALIGDITVKSDTVTYPTYTFTNCSIASMPNLKYNGEDPNCPIELRGYYLVNNSLWNPI